MFLYYSCSWTWYRCQFSSAMFGIPSTAGCLWQCTTWPTMSSCPGRRMRTLTVEPTAPYHTVCNPHSPDGWIDVGWTDEYCGCTVNQKSWAYSVFIFTFFIRFFSMDCVIKITWYQDAIKSPRMDPWRGLEMEDKSEGVNNWRVSNAPLSRLYWQFYSAVDKIEQWRKPIKMSRPRMQYEGPEQECHTPHEDLNWFRFYWRDVVIECENVGFLLL